MIDNSNITKNQRSNSYIENYNRSIKLKLSKFLYGKSKCKISWPLFLYFIKIEEKVLKGNNYELENEIDINLNSFRNTKDIENELDNKYSDTSLVN